MAYKKIEGIKPFNDLQLKSCYYHQLAAALTGFGVNPQIVAGNYLPLYKYDAKQKSLALNCSEILDEYKLEFWTGVQINKYKNIDKLKEFVCEQIDTGTPVLLLVDCFYLDYREDTYLKNHNSHSILIYGYDSKERTFIISEHMYLNSYQYMEKFAPMDVIIKAYNNFVARLMKNDWSLVTLTRKREARDFTVENFAKEIKLRKEDLQNSLREFRKGMEFLCSCLFKQERFEQERDNMIFFIGKVLGYKNIQKNIIGYLWGYGGIYKAADRIVENYIFIYGVLIKMRALKQYNIQYIEKIMRRCSELLELESELHARLERGNYE